MCPEATPCGLPTEAFAWHFGKAFFPSAPSLAAFSLAAASAGGGCDGAGESTDGWCAQPSAHASQLCQPHALMQAAAAAVEARPRSRSPKRIHREVTPCRQLTMSSGLHRKKVLSNLRDNLGNAIFAIRHWQLGLGSLRHRRYPGGRRQILYHRGSPRPRGQLTLKHNISRRRPY